MLLSLNTCGNTASVALGVADKNEVRIVATAELAVRTYSARLIPEIAALLERNMRRCAMLRPSWWSTGREASPASGWV